MKVVISFVQTLGKESVKDFYDALREEGIDIGMVICNEYGYILHVYDYDPEWITHKEHITKLLIRQKIECLLVLHNCIAKGPFEIVFSFSQGKKTKIRIK